MFWGFYNTIFCDYKCICSYFHMSFCTKKWKLLQLNVSSPNHILHKKSCTTDKYCFGKQPCRAQHSSAVVRAGGIHTEVRGVGWLRNSSHFPPPSPDISGMICPFSEWSRCMSRSPCAPPQTCGEKNAHSSAGLVTNHCQCSRSNTSPWQPPVLTPAQG